MKHLALIAVLTLSIDFVTENHKEYVVIHKDGEKIYIEVDKKNMDDPDKIVEQVLERLKHD
jgi:hypothetical protein